jgi:hypothetical protein
MRPFRPKSRWRPLRFAARRRLPGLRRQAWARAKSKWWFPSPLPPGIDTGRTAAPRISPRLIAPAPAGTSGWFATATRAAPAFAKPSVRMTQAPITPALPRQPRQCPQQDARICPPDDGLTYLAPDLSATVYGGESRSPPIAREMGRAAEESRWLEAAAAIRKPIPDRLYNAGDDAFYGIDSDDRSVRIRGDVIARVIGAHAAKQKLFDEVYRRQLRNPNRVLDALSVFFHRRGRSGLRPPHPAQLLGPGKLGRRQPGSHRAGHSAMNGALRQYADFRRLMTRWVEALRSVSAVDGPGHRRIFPRPRRLFARHADALRFRMAALWRAAVRRYYRVELPPEDAASTTAQWGMDELRADRVNSLLTLAGKQIARLRGTARSVTTTGGKLVRLIATEPRASPYRYKTEGVRKLITSSLIAR